MELLTFTGTPGITNFFALPEGSSLSDWETNARFAQESDPGSYQVEVDPAIATVWRLFLGNEQPVSWDAWIEVFSIQRITVMPTQGQTTLVFSTADIEATTDASFLIARSVLDNLGAPVDLPVCDFVLCDKDQKHIATLTPTITASSYTIMIPRSLTKSERTIYFALRQRTSENVDFDAGTIRFLYAATKPN